MGIHNHLYQLTSDALCSINHFVLFCGNQPSDSWQIHQLEKVKVMAKVKTDGYIYEA